MTDYCSKYTKKGVYDKIAGMLFGHALGDAVGLMAEFQEQIPPDLKYPYEVSIRGLKPCDWTDDTDLLLLTIGSLMENNMRFVRSDIAQRFAYWCQNGLPYTGDKAPKTPNNTFKFIVTQKDYLTNVQGVVKRVAEQSKGSLTGNSPITRIAIAGTLPNPEEMAKELCEMTHIDKRCVASCIFYTCTLNALIYSEEIDIDFIISSAKGIALEHLDAEQQPEFEATLQKGMQAPVSAFNLGEIARASNIYKTLLCIMYALNIIKISQKNGKVPCFKKCVHSVIICGGDADANGIMVGSILGAYLGYSQLPQEWVQALPNGIQLNQFIASYMGRLFNPTTIEDNQATAEAYENTTENTAENTTENTTETNGSL